MIRRYSPAVVAVSLFILVLSAHVQAQSEEENVPAAEGTQSAGELRQREKALTAQLLQLEADEGEIDEGIMLAQAGRFIGIISGIGTGGFVGVICFVLIALLLVLTRPTLALRWFEPAWVKAQLSPLFKREEAFPAKTRQVTIAIALVVLLIVLLLPSFASAQTDPRATLDRVQTAVESPEPGSTIARLEWLLDDPSRSGLFLDPVAVKNAALFPYTRVMRDSFEHLYTLGALYLEAGDSASAHTTFEKAIASRRRGPAADFERAVANLQKVYQTNGWLDQHPDRLDWVVDNVNAVFLLLDLAGEFEKNRPEWTTRFIETAKKRAKDIHQNLALAGYLSKKGETTDLEKTLQKAGRAVRRMQRVSDLIEVARAAAAGGFNELMSETLTQARKKARKTDDVLLYARFLLNANNLDDAKAVLDEAIKKQVKFDHLIALAEFAREASLIETAQTGMTRSIEQARNKKAIRVVVESLVEQGDIALLKAALTKALEISRGVDALEWIGSVAEQAGLNAIARHARGKAAETARSLRDILSVLENAIERGDFLLAAETAAIVRKSRGLSYLIETGSLGLPAGTFPTGASGRASYAAYAGKLFHEAGSIQEGIAVLTDSLYPLLSAIVYGELNKFPRRDGLVLLNDLYTLRALCLVDGSPFADRAAHVDSLIDRTAKAFTRRSQTKGLAARITQLEEELAAASARVEDKRGLLARLKLDFAVYISKLLITLIVLLLTVIVPTLAGIEAMNQAQEFKAFAFAVRWTEVCGWMLCMSVLGLPVGLLLVLVAQGLRIIGRIQENTRPDGWAEQESVSSTGTGLELAIAAPALSPTPSATTP